MQILLNTGSDINAHRAYFSNALLSAFARGQEQLCQVLIKSEVKLKSIEFCFLASTFRTLLNESNFTVLAKIAQRIKEENINNNIIQELLYLTTKTHTPDSITQRLLQYSASLTAPGLYGWTPAMCSKVSHKTSPWFG